MKPDKLTLSLLFDCYGELLTDKQRDCFDLHYNQDLTLAEIAELMGTSRQGVHDAVTRAEAQLLRYEEVTHSLRHATRTQQIAADLEALAKDLLSRGTEESDRSAKAILAAANELMEE